MMNCHRVLFGVLFGLWLICGCGSKVVTPNSSVLKDNVYTNKFFAFKVQIPDTWTVLKKPNAREMKATTEVLMGGDKKAAAAAVQSMARVYCLLLARNVVVGMSIAVTAESLKRVPEIKTGQEYLEQSLELMSGPGKPLQQAAEITPVQLFGREFYRVDFAGSFMGVRQHQAMFATVDKGHALLFVMTGRTAPAVEEAIAMVGLHGSDGNQFTGTSKNVRTVAARAPSDPSIKLQGIGGTKARRLAIINGKTLAAGDGTQVTSGGKTVVIRCVAVGETTATITIDGAEGERELRLN
jgi:hypothetical protein